MDLERLATRLRAGDAAVELLASVTDEQLEWLISEIVQWTALAEPLAGACVAATGMGREAWMGVLSWWLARPQEDRERMLQEPDTLVEGVPAEGALSGHLLEALTEAAFVRLASDLRPIWPMPAFPSLPQADVAYPRCAWYRRARAAELSERVGVEVLAEFLNKVWWGLLRHRKVEIPGFGTFLPVRTGRAEDGWDVFFSHTGRAAERGPFDPLLRHIQGQVPRGPFLLAPLGTFSWMEDAGHNGRPADGAPAGGVTVFTPSPLLRERMNGVRRLVAG